MPPTGKKTPDGTKAARSKSAPAERQTADVVRRARLEDEEWYVGMMGRDGIEPFLTTDGEFAVRASEKNGKCELVLVVRAADRINHVTIRWCPRNAHWTVLPGPDPKGFPSLAEMIAFYAANDLKLGGRKFRLRRPCAKPRWWVSRRDIVYSTRDRLGQGNFCDVYKGRWDRKDVAVKICRDADGRKSDEDRQVAAARDTLMQEGKLMLEVRHVNVIQFFGMACEQPPRRCWVVEAEARSTMMPVKEELEAISADHPYTLEELAVNRIPGVRAMAPAWIRAVQRVCEDVERDVLTAAAAGTPTAAESPAAPVEGREPIVEEPTGTTNTSAAPPSRRSARRSRTETGHFEEAPQPTASNEPLQASRKSRKSARSGKSAAQPAAKPPQGNEK
ncbi:Tyrosine-protein kinase [Aphelenchoides fujianensis]|nr:Tyrosine-protein kinase [Aphelenchoides fujianensis]